MFALHSACFPTSTPCVANKCEVETVHGELFHSEIKKNEISSSDESKLQSTSWSAFTQLEAANAESKIKRPGTDIRMKL
ncbi:hypothetical protein RRG08_062683 [Elysia crispata]|uniref:Uncharacterized protein n=1 Tax=Elysia crispata TaxID=231223 RepID=A0AAE1CIX0_9GAST|nr:hypothetical protein RRG08_062683 [Elysia crispata]